MKKWRERKKAAPHAKISRYGPMDEHHRRIEWRPPLRSARHVELLHYTTRKQVLGPPQKYRYGDEPVPRVDEIFE